MLGADGFEKPVAIKLLRMSGSDGRLAEEAQQRFRDEARLLGLLRHRAIVQVDGLVRLAGHQAVVMEYLEGVSLRALVKRGPVPLGPALEIVAEVAAALEAAWQRPGPAGRPLNVCHRDLKPANLQLSADGEVKVLDFGIARADFQAREAATGSLAMGSVEYMSPARLDFEDDGAAGDIYSLGCVLYELVVGEAFGRSSANPVSHAARFDANIERVPSSLRALVGQMLAFDAAARPNAKDVERACLELARGTAPRLREWAADAVPSCAALVSPANGAWTGRVFTEDREPAVAPRAVVVGGNMAGNMPAGFSGGLAGAGPQSVAMRSASGGHVTSGPVSKGALRSGPITASGRGAANTGPAGLSGPVSVGRSPEATVAVRRAGAAALGVLGIGALALAVILGVVAYTLAGSKPASAPAPLAAPSSLPVASAPAAAPRPPVAKPAVPEVVGASSAATPPTGGAPAVPIKVPAPVSAPKRAAPAGNAAVPRAVAEAAVVPDAESTLSTVHVSGDAESVRLRKGDSYVGLSRLPSGTYTVLATFAGVESEAGSVSIGEGEQVNLRCSKAFLRCSRK
jgi:serine/threonine-protein kinase